MIPFVLMLDSFQPPLLGSQPELGKRCLGFGRDPNLFLGSQLGWSSPLVVVGALIRVLVVFFPVV